MKEEEKLANEIKLFKSSAHWHLFQKLFNQRFQAHHTAIETEDSPNEFHRLQGRLTELRDIFNWFDYREEVLELDGVIHPNKDNTPEEEY